MRIQKAIVTAASIVLFCLISSARAACPGDVNNNGATNVDDLLTVIGAWGACAGCPADVNHNGFVNVDDLLMVIGAWGPCPSGACCFANGACALLTETNCANGAGTYSGNGTACGAVVCPIRPPNDLCGDAIIVNNGSTSWNNANATVSGPIFSACETPMTRDIWFKYTATLTGFRTIDTVGSLGNWNTILAAYAGTCNSLTGIACNDDAGAFTSSITIPVVMGQQILIRVSSWSAAGPEGAGVLTIH